MVGGGGSTAAAFLTAAIVSAAPVAAEAAERSGTDLNRIATLVYQAADTQNAAARRADAVIGGLRRRVETSSALLASTRASLAEAKARGARSEARLRQLQRELDRQELEAAEAKSAFAAELAAKDSEYARERSMLVTTGQQLLETPEGRRVLDLYNEGGDQAWQEAKLILATVRRLRRAADTRAAAQLYLNKLNAGKETTDATLALFEEVVADDPSRSRDWTELADLYSSKGEARKALAASERAVAAAAGVPERALALKTRALAEARLGGTEQAKASFEEALALVRAELAASPGSLELRYLAVQMLQGLADLAGRHSRHAVAIEHLNDGLALLSIELPSNSPSRFAFRYARSLMHARIAATQRDLGQYDEALASFENSVGLAKAIIGEGFQHRAVKEGLAYTLMQTSYMLLWAADPPKALAYSEESVSLFRSLAASDGGSQGLRNNLASALAQLGAAHRRLGANEAALKALLEAASILRAHAAQPDAAPSVLADLATTLSAAGSVLGSLSRTDEAVQQIRSAIEHRERAVEKMPEFATAASSLANDHLALAGLLEARDRPEALRHYREALARVRALIDKYPAQPPYRHDLAATLIRYAAALEEGGEREQALAALREAEKSQRKLVADQPRVPNYRILLAILLLYEGQVEARAGDKAAATAKLAESLAASTLLAKELPSRPEPQRNIGRALAGLAELGAPGYDWTKVVDHYERLGAASTLSEEEKTLLADARRNAVAGPPGEAARAREEPDSR